MMSIGVARLTNDDSIDLEQLRLATSGFHPVWMHLAPREQERVLRLLIERITYDPDTRESEFELRACGVEALAKEATA